MLYIHNSITVLWNIDFDTKKHWLIPCPEQTSSRQEKLSLTKSGSNFICDFFGTHNCFWSKSFCWLVVPFDWRKVTAVRKSGLSKHSVQTKCCHCWLQVLHQCPQQGSVTQVTRFSSLTSHGVISVLTQVMSTRPGGHTSVPFGTAQFHITLSIRNLYGKGTIRNSWFWPCTASSASHLKKNRRKRHQSVQTYIGTTGAIAALGTISEDLGDHDQKTMQSKTSLHAIVVGMYSSQALSCWDFGFLSSGCFTT